MTHISAGDLYDFIREQAEEIDGRLVCRVSLVAELRRRGVEAPGRVRRRLVKELTDRGLVLRPHPRTSWLIITDPGRALPATDHERFMDRMGFGDEPGAIKVNTSGISHDANATKRRLDDLQGYMSKNVLAGKDFKCSSWEACESSIGDTCSFTEGQLSHVGKHFDLRRGFKEVRVVVVGQEVGATGHPRTTLAERYRTIHDGNGMKKRFGSDGVHKRRNPHMRGTTLALRTILGTGAGIERDGESVDISGEQVHIFDCFALVNRLICSAHLTGTSTGQSTKTMLDNCERHFQATLEILEPTIVVLQGVRMWRWSKRVLVPKRKLSDHLTECSINGKRTLVCAFSHPSSYGKKPTRWDSPNATYFQEIVYPTLSRAAAI